LAKQHDPPLKSLGVYVWAFLFVGQVGHRTSEAGSLPAAKGALEARFEAEKYVTK